MQVYRRRYKDGSGREREGRFWIMDVAPAESWDGRRHRISLRVVGGERAAWAAAEKKLEELRAGLVVDRRAAPGPLVEAFLAELRRRHRGEHALPGPETAP